MRVKRNKADGTFDAERSRKRHRDHKRGGTPKLALWECGIGSVWK